MTTFQISQQQQQINGEQGEESFTEIFEAEETNSENSAITDEHYVNDGDTWQSIANLYGVSVSKLQELNSAEGESTGSTPNMSSVDIPQN